MTSPPVLDSEPDFDEQGALEELEALHAAIRAVRSGSAPVAPASTSTATNLDPGIDRDLTFAPARPPRRYALVIAGVGAVIAALLALTLLPWRGSSSGGQPPVEQPPAASIPAPAPPPPPVDPHPVRADLTLGRRVWMRVTVDGTVMLEREAVAGEKLHFGGDRSIVVRTGDAGGVSVRVNEVDQGPMGRDGQVLTRLFEPPVKQ